ncbi:hypothetical protein H5410_033090, partial [Solanum commersonii]
MERNVGLVNNSHIQKIKVVKMRMLRYMYGHTRRVKIRNNVMRDKRRCTNAPVRKWERLVMTGFRRGRGRPRKYWGEMIRRDMAQLQLTITLDRWLWRTRIRVE